MPCDVASIYSSWTLQLGCVLVSKLGVYCRVLIVKLKYMTDKYFFTVGPWSEGYTEGEAPPDPLPAGPAEPIDRPRAEAEVMQLNILPP